MEISKKHITSPDRCGYLPDRKWSLEYNFVTALSPDEYQALIERGWRKYGHALFRPVCQNCRECRPVRVLCRDFEPSRSQKRTLEKNRDIEVVVSEAAPDREIFELYVRHHESRSAMVGWPEPDFLGSMSHLSTMVDNPFPIEQWCHFLEGNLVGTCYVDPLPAGLSAVYSFYDPDLPERSLGTWMILSLIERCRSLGLPYLYLGYYVEGCRSMSYKKKFLPQEVQDLEGNWVVFSR